jgi:N-methylhydantoinase B
MGVVLNRTAYSPNIKERRDFSCAIFDGKGNMVAQAAHIPVHLGSMPLSVTAAISNQSFAPGDMVMLNDPYKGGTHLPDITLVAPVFFQTKEKPDFYVANRAHHADVGGMSSGSMPISTSVFQEGIIIPPLKIIEKGKIDTKLMAFFLNNVRTPDEREGDFSAQIMANLTGIERLREIERTYGYTTISFYAGRLMDYSERIMRKTIREIPDGTYEFGDFLDDDGQGNEMIRIHVNITIKNDTAIVDFQKSSPQVEGSINAVYAITLSAVLYVFRALITEDVPTNAGCFRPIRVKTSPGSVVNATFPAAVAGGNVETSQRIVDTVMGALSAALPESIPAASQGTMNNITIGGFDEEKGRSFAYYETLAGGMGGSFHHSGESAVHSHMTNTLNTPIEALEFTYPFRITEYSIRKGSGGAGRSSGGDGLVREIALLSDAEVTVLSERRKTLPYGLFGGQPGKPGKNLITENGRSTIKPGKFSARLKKNSVIRIETPGGGGYGSEKIK